MAVLPAGPAALQMQVVFCGQGLLSSWPSLVFKNRLDKLLSGWAILDPVSAQEAALDDLSDSLPNLFFSGSKQQREADEGRRGTSQG